MNIPCEKRGSAAVAWCTGTSHRFYEDRYRLLPREVPLVGRQDRGEIFAVFDGIGGAPKGRDAAQEMSDWLIKYYQESERYPASARGLHQLLMDANLSIYDWGMIPGTDQTLGGCAGTVAWIYQETIFIFHSGDTVAFLIRDQQALQLTRLHEMNGAIYNFFGIGPNLKVELEQRLLQEFDMILLFSDGVSKVYHPTEAADVIVNEIGKHDNISRAAKELARRSRALGSPDDITVLLIEIEE